MDEDLQSAEGELMRLMRPPPVGGYTLVPESANRAARNDRSAWILVSLAVLVTIGLALLASNQGTFMAAALALIAGLFQVGSVLISTRTGRADRNLVRHLARRLQRLGFRMNSAIALAEQAYKDCTPDSSAHSSARSAVGRLSVELDTTREAMGELLETWRDLNPELFAEGDDSGGEQSGAR